MDKLVAQTALTATMTPSASTALPADAREKIQISTVAQQVTPFVRGMREETPVVKHYLRADPIARRGLQQSHHRQARVLSQTASQAAGA